MIYCEEIIEFAKQKNWKEEKYDVDYYDEIEVKD
jgi:hypothetical protein